MTEKETYRQAYKDYISACGLYNGEDFNELYNEIDDSHNNNGELFDFNFGTTCLTINKYGGDNPNKKGCGYVNEYSIEVWQGDKCLGIFTAQQLAKLSEIDKEELELPNNLELDGFEFLSERQQSEIVDDINSFLARTYGFCNKGFGWEISIKLTNIDWDTEE